MQNSDIERERLLLGLLASVEKGGARSQRYWASEFGIALGMVNAYLKYCIKKGYVKVKRIPARRYSYYLTPKGFVEKSRLSAAYLSNAFTFFRQACTDCSDVLEEAKTQGWNRIAIYGTGELADIAYLCAINIPVKLVGVIDLDTEERAYRNLPICRDLAALGQVDAVIMAAQKDPQGAYNFLVTQLPAERVLTPQVLHISRKIQE